jgi:hypothetical protein
LKLQNDKLIFLSQLWEGIFLLMHFIP